MAIFQAFLVTLREGVATALIAGIAFAGLAKRGRDDRHKNDLRKNDPREDNPHKNGLCKNDSRKKRSAQGGMRRSGSVDFTGSNGDGRRVATGMDRALTALTDLAVGEAGTIEYVSLPPAEEHFLMRIGFAPGAQVRFLRSAPLGDPSVYSVDGTEIALRAETARCIMVRRGWLSPLGDLP